MSSSADHSAQALPERVYGLCRVLLQARLLIALITTLVALPAITSSVTVAAAMLAATFVSYVSLHHWRRIAPRLARHPILIGLDVVVSFAILQLAGPLSPFFLFTVVTSALAGLLYRWHGIAYVCLLQVLFYYAAVGTRGDIEMLTNFQVLLGQPAYYPVVGFVGVAVRRLLDDQERSEDALRRAEATAAAADERTRLAREMHDSLAKTLRGIAMSATALPSWVRRSPERATEEAGRIASAAEAASREARSLIDDLRTDDLDRPVAESVRAVVREWSDETGIPAHARLDDGVELGLVARYEVLAILKEALGNVDRHAQAGSVEVTVSREGHDAVLVVRDDGRGFDHGEDVQAWARDGHYGLVGMRERAARAGGTLSLASAPGSGSTVRVALPVSSSAADRTERVSPAPASTQHTEPAEAG